MIPEPLRQTIVSRIRDVCDPDRIILFGSHAQGKADENSDVDLLIIKSGVQHRRSLAVAIYRALKGIETPVDVLVATPEIFDRYKQYWSTVYYAVANEGEIIYERTD